MKRSYNGSVKTTLKTKFSSGDELDLKRENFFQKRKIEESSSGTDVKVDQVPEFSQISKESIAFLLEGALHLPISQNVLADITGDALSVVGRAKIPGIKNQLCHIIPIAFIQAMIQNIIAERVDCHQVLDKLSLVLTRVTKSQKGFAIKSSDLELGEYSKIVHKIVECADRKIEGKESVYLVSPSKQKILFDSPTKMKKAETEFSEYNTQFIAQTLDKLSELVQDDNTACIVSELIIRYIFGLHNSGENAVFASEGNTARYEIRLYKTEEGARSGGTGYEVFTSREVKAMYDNGDNLSKCIRIVDSEGSQVKNCVKSLAHLKNMLALPENIYSIILNYNLTNKPIKLSNYEGELLDYNNPIILNEFIQNQIAYHVAKNLYRAFDLKALENIVFVVGKELPVYKSATGDRVAKYSFKSGEKHRKIKMDEANYSDNKFFRSAEKDLQILPHKLVELFLTGASSFFSVKASQIDFLDLCLSKLVALASKDYCMNIPDTIKFSKEVQGIYEATFGSSSFSVNQDITLKLLGEDFLDYNHLLGFKSPPLELVDYI